MESNSVTDSCTENDPEVQFYQGFSEPSNDAFNQSSSSKTYMSNFLSTIRSPSSNKSPNNSVSSCKCCLVY